jgi:DNA-binding response OmpR family regulator
MPGPDRALIIEDDEDIADVVSLHLKDLGLTAERAVNWTFTSSALGGHLVHGRSG